MATGDLPQNNTIVNNLRTTKIWKFKVYKTFFLSKKNF